MTSQRKKTAPSTQKYSRSSPSSRNGLIAKEKTKKQTAEKRTVLDNHFHSTAQRSAAGTALQTVAPTMLVRRFQSAGAQS